MGSYSEPGSHLCHILRRLNKNHRLDEKDKAWIKSKNMVKFHAFVIAWEKTGNPNFKPLRLRKERELWNREVTRLSDQFGVNIRPGSPWHKRFRKIINSKRFSKGDVVWLHNHEFFKPEVRIIYHRKEAQHYLHAYRKDKQLWDLVNASSHLRKCHKPERALEEMAKVKTDKLKNKRLKSAISVTTGGAYRDIENFDKALEFAEKGHQSDPKSYHPCTLFGAVYYQTQQYDLGAKWYKKAEQKGAEPNAVDSEIRTLLKQVRGQQREKLKQHLLNLDPVRYEWVKRIGDRKKHKN